MRSFAVLCVAVLSLSIPLYAREIPTITSLTPDSLHFESGEWFMTILGPHYLPTAGVTVIFNGPGGTFALTPNASTDTKMVVWVPQEIVQHPGVYGVTVRVPNGAGGTIDSNSKVLTVFGNLVVVHLPKVVYAEAINLDGGPVQFDVTATSYASDQVTVTCSAKSGDFFPFGSSGIDCVATDGEGNEDKGSFTAQVADTTPPAISTPREPLTFGKDEGTDYVYDVKASDLVDPDVAVSCTPASGSFFKIGTSSITCTSTDRFKNTATTTFRVHVGSDAIPAMVIPTSVSAEAASIEGQFVKYDYSATTIDGKAAEVKCDPGPGSLFAIGTTSVKCIAWGPAGASTTDFFNLTVADTTPPVLALPGDMSVQAPSPEGAVVDYRVSAKDAVDGATDVACFPAAGSLFAPGDAIVNCSSSDKTRNVANGTFVVTVQPWADPTIYSVPADSTDQ